MTASGDKRCAKCEVLKPLEDFNRRSRSPDGRQSYCRECKRTLWGDWRLANPDRLSDTHRRWRDTNREYDLERKRVWSKANPDKSRLASARRRARKAGVLFIPMTRRELRRLYSHPCAHCGATESLERDHIIPIARGGPDTFGNSQMLCKPCNTSKHTKFEIEQRAYRRRIERAA